MEIARLGEQALVRRIQEMLAASLGDQPGVLLGIGDDTALVRSPGAHELLTVDHQVEGVHFRRRWGEPGDLGWKALAVNVSDIAAMGGVPAAALVSLALPPETELAWVEGFYAGLAEAARCYGVAVVGGDTSAAPLIVVSVTLTGSPPLDAEGQPRPLLRSAGRPGDVVAVTGALGAAAAGLRLLQSGPVREEDTAALRHAFLRPMPSVAAGRLLAGEGVRAALDISDGLAMDLGRLCEASGLAAEIRAAVVPVHSQVAASFPEEAREMALTGGEDYELLFAARPEVVERVRTRASVPVTAIGELVAGHPGRVRVRDEAGREVALTRHGWHHF